MSTGPDTMEQDEILGRIPHRLPFLWIDRVETIEPGLRCVAFKYVNPTEPFFAGHFPGRPVLPGVLLIEAVAQAACVMLASSSDLGMAEGIPLMAAVNRFKFLKTVSPGALLRVEVRTLTTAGKLALVEGSVEVDGDLVARGELSLAGP